MSSTLNVEEKDHVLYLSKNGHTFAKFTANFDGDIQIVTNPEVWGGYLEADETDTIIQYLQKHRKNMNDKTN